MLRFSSLTRYQFIMITYHLSGVDREEKHFCVKQVKRLPSSKDGSRFSEKYILQKYHRLYFQVNGLK